MIIISPAGGICNRITSLEAAYHLSRRLHQKCIVLWNLKDELNCNFSTLFQNIEGMKFISVRSCDRVDHFIQLGCRALLKQSFFYDFNNNYYDKQCKKKIDYLFNDNLNSEFDMFFDNKKLIYLKDPYYSFYGKLTFHIVRANSNIEKAVNSLIDDKKEYIGIHIRGTDHQECRKHVKVELYIEKLKEEIEHNSDILFYLATDEDKVRERFIEQFGDRIKYNKSTVFNRTTDKGVISGLVDLICLSRTKMIYGSYASTFSLYAASMNNTPMKICVNGRWGQYRYRILDNIDLMSERSIQFD